MWELIESLVYYFKSKGKTLPLLLVLILIALAFWFYSYDPSKKAETPPAIKEIPAEPVPEKQSEPNMQLAPESKLPVEEIPIPNQTHGVQRSEEPQRQEIEPETAIDREDPINQPETSYGMFVLTLENELRSEGIDRDLARKITVQIRNELPKHSETGVLDLSGEVRKVLGPQASEEEVRRLHQLILEAATRSFQQYAERNNIELNR